MEREKTTEMERHIMSYNNNAAADPCYINKHTHRKCNKALGGEMTFSSHVLIFALLYCRVLNSTAGDGHMKHLSCVTRGVNISRFLSSRGAAWMCPAECHHGVIELNAPGAAVLQRSMMGCGERRLGEGWLKAG